MSEIEGTELALAVAGAMGKQAIKCHGTVRLVTRVYSDRDAHRTEGVDVPTRPWRPDLGGAAGAEVLEWAHEHGAVHIDTSPEQCWCLITPWEAETEADQVQATGPTIWIALCRAVVAAGGEE